MKKITKLALALILAPTFALAAPTGAVVTGGSGSVTSTKVTNINQNTVHLPKFNNVGGTVPITLPNTGISVPHTVLPTPTIPVSSIRGDSPTPILYREVNIDVTRLGLDNAAQRINYMKAQTSVNMNNLETASGNSDPAQSINLIGVDDSLSLK